MKGLQDWEVRGRKQVGRRKRIRGSGQKMR